MNFSLSANTSGFCSDSHILCYVLIIQWTPLNTQKKANCVARNNNLIVRVPIFLQPSFTNHYNYYLTLHNLAS